MRLFIMFAATLLASTMATESTNTEWQDSSLLSASLLSFGARFFEASKNHNQNVILSPISLHSALGMLHLGSKDSSKTQLELSDVMSLKKLGSSADKIHSIYGETIKKFKNITAVGAERQKKLHQQSKQMVEPKWDDPEWQNMVNGPKPPVIDIWTMLVAGQLTNTDADYAKGLQDSYQSKIEAPKNDLEKRQLINETKQWAKEAGFGDGVIGDDDIGSKPDEITLLSAINVAAFWMDKFDENKRSNGFFNYGDQSKPAIDATILSQMMFYGKYVEFSANPSVHTRQATRQSKNYSRLTSLNCRAMSLPLHGNVSFDVFEPLNNGSGHDLADLEAKLLADDGSLEQALEILDQRQNSQEFGRIAMPAFKFESSIDASQALKSLGLESVFSDKKAELHKMSSMPLYVGKASHKAVIELEKGGIKAAAITSIKVYPMSLRLDPLNVKIENPYFFLVRHNTTPLFMGHLVHL